MWFCHSLYRLAIHTVVDATSFVLMRDEPISTALTLDRHFAQEGFAVIPTPEELLDEPGPPYGAATEAAGPADIPKRPATE